VTDIRNFPLAGKSAIICGASKGIGKETAKRFVHLGGSSLLVARTLSTLDETAQEVRAESRLEGQIVESAACDATDEGTLKLLFDDHVQKRGVPDYLLNLVGGAYPQYLERLELEHFRQAMELNYFGQLIPTYTMLPYFLEAQRGHIAFASSMMGYFGIIGYAAYAPAKFATIGFAEVLRHELKPYGIKISVLFPPDTDTPGFENENRSKPPETAMLSQGAGLMSSSKVAEIFVEGLIKENYFILKGEASLAWRIHRFFPWLMRMITDSQYVSARKKLGKVS
jgi:3-dehydrosphinganine reductase